MYAPVGLSQYEGMALHGFGSSTSQQIGQLNKALSSGYQTTNQTGGSAMRVESLEESLKVLSHTDRHLKLWPKLYKSPAYSTVEEYNQLIEYGDNSYGPFLREGELGIANDSQFQRRTQLIKFMGTTREVTHPATLVHPAHGDLIALENQNGIMWLLRQIERYLFKGDSTLAALGGESEQWDGLDALIDSENFLDLEGAPLQEADFEEATNLLAEYYAYPTDAFLGFRPMSDLSKTMYPKHRVNLPDPTNGVIGQSVQAIHTQAGLLNFNADVFLTRPDTAPDAVRGPSSLVPTAPASIAATANTSATTGEFDKSQGSDSANYAYKVTACNRFGESAATTAVIGSAALTGAQALAGAAYSLTITNAASMATAPEYYRVYRTVALDSTISLSDAQALSSESFSLIKEIPAQSVSAGGVTPASGSILDDNRTMPFTEVAYVGELTPQVITFRQLAPLMKLDLAVLAPAYRWMIMLYGALLLFAPRKWCRIINIGRLGSS
jgi:hypothetical protein